MHVRFFIPIIYALRDMALEQPFSRQSRSLGGPASYKYALGFAGVLL